MRYPACVEQVSPDAGSGRPGGLIGAVDNVLRLLRLFEDHEMIRVNQVAREMGLSRSTVHRMLATLSHHQFVEQDELSRAYKPGPALVDIGLSVVSKIEIRAISHTALVSLRDLTGETAHLGVMRGDTSVLFLDGVESDQIVRTGSRVGRILPAHSTATGKVLLAERTDEEIAARYPSGVLEAPTPRALTSLGELLEEIAEVRRLGYAVNHGESENGVGSVGMAVFDPAGEPRAALSVALPLNRWTEDTEERAAGALRSATAALGAHL